MYKVFTILDRYLGKEILLTGLAVMLVLLLVVMSTEVARWLAAVVEGRITLDILMPILMTSLVKYTVVLMPISMMLTVMLVFGRLYKDSEMAAIMSAGCGPMSWYRPVIWIVVPAAIALLVMTLLLVPELNARKQQLLEEANNRQDLASLMAGRFNAARSGEAVFFIEQQADDGTSVEGVFYKSGENLVDTVDVASRAKNVRDEQGATYLLMQDGHQYVGNADSHEYRIIEYEEYGVRLPDRRVAEKVRAVKAMPSSALFESEIAEHQAELHWRITIPIGMLIITLIAVPLSYTRPRSGRYAKVAVALVIYLLYSNLLGMSVRWMEDGTLPVWLAAWWVHAIGIVGLLGLLKYYGYLMPLKPIGKKVA